MARMQEFYGREGHDRAADALAGRSPALWENDEEVVDYPLFEEAIVNAEGVIVHSRAHHALVRERWFGPTAALHLPCYSDNLTREVSPLRQLEANARLMLLTVGCVNRNKQIHQVIEVLGSDPDLADQVRYVVIGAYEENRAYSEELFALVRKYSLSRCVKFLGYQKDEILNQYIAAADIFINLRHPCMEGSSASLMLQLTSGKPVVVFDAGIYGEVPGDCVARVKQGDPDALAHCVRQLVTEEKLRSAIGARGKKLAAEFNEEQYASEFLAFTDEVKRWRPLLDLCDGVSEQLRWMGGFPEMNVIDAVAREIEIFSGRIAKGASQARTAGEPD